MQAGGRTRARPYGLVFVRKGLIGCMSLRSKDQDMGIRLIPPRRMTDLSPVIYCEIDSSVISTGGAWRTPRRRPSCPFRTN